MTKTEQLTRIAETLSEDQVEGLLSFASYLSSDPFYATASDEALASIERGLSDIDAGKVRSAADVFGRIDTKIAARNR